MAKAKIERKTYYAFKPRAVCLTYAEHPLVGGVHVYLGQIYELNLLEKSRGSYSPRYRPNSSGEHALNFIRPLSVPQACGRRYNEMCVSWFSGGRMLNCSPPKSHILSSQLRCLDPSAGHFACLIGRPGGRMDLGTGIYLSCHQSHKLCRQG